MTYWMNRLQRFESARAAVRHPQPARARWRSKGEVCREVYEHPIFDGAGDGGAAAAVVAAGRAATPGSAGPGSAPASTRTGCRRAWPWPSSSAACGGPGRWPTSPAASSWARRRVRATAGAGGMNVGIYRGVVTHRAAAAQAACAALPGLPAAARPRRGAGLGRQPAVRIRSAGAPELPRARPRRRLGDAAEGADRAQAAPRPGSRRRAGAHPLHAAGAGLRLQPAVDLLLPPRATAGWRRIVYEVNNTFGERHSYVLPVRARRRASRRAAPSACTSRPSWTWT